MLCIFFFKKKKEKQQRQKSTLKNHIFVQSGIITDQKMIKWTFFPGAIISPRLCWPVAVARRAPQTPLSSKSGFTQPQKRSNDAISNMDTERTFTLTGVLMRTVKCQTQSLQQPS